MAGGLFCKCAERCAKMNGDDFEHFKKFRPYLMLFLKCKSSIIDIIDEMKKGDTAMVEKRGGRSKRTNYMVGGMFCDKECSCENYELYDDYMKYMEYKSYVEYYIAYRAKIDKIMNENHKDVPLDRLKCGEPIGLAGGGLKTLRYNNIMS